MNNFEEEYENFEFRISLERDKESLNFLTKKILECLLGIKDIKLQFNKDLIRKNFLITALQNEKRLMVTKKRKREILEYLDKININDFYLTCSKDKSLFLKAIFKEDYEKIKDLDDKLYYFNTKNYSKEKIEFIKDFINEFKDEVIFYEDSEILDTLNLTPISIPRVNIEKGVFYLIKKVLEKNYRSNFFIKKSNLDSQNKERLLDSKIPYFDCYNLTLKSKYMLILSYAKVNLNDNLTTCNPNDIIKSLKNPYILESLNFKVSEKVKNLEKIENFNYNYFSDIDKAICFNIYLGEIGVDGLLIVEMEKFYICYNNPKIEIPSDFGEDYYRTKIIHALEKLTNIKVDYSKYSIKELINCYNDNGVLIFEDHLTKINPIRPIHLPLEYFNSRGCGMFNLNRDTSGLLKGIFKEKLIFNDKRINITSPVEFVFTEKIKNFWKIDVIFKKSEYVLVEEIEIKEKINLDYIFQKLWKKGYLLSKYGLQNYIDYGYIKGKDIKFRDPIELKEMEDLKWLRAFVEKI